MAELAAIQNELPIFDGPALVAGPVFFMLEVLGEPVPKGRPRARIVTPRHGRQFISFYPPAETAAYEAMLKQYAALKMRGRAPTLRPVKLFVGAFVPIPKSWSDRDYAAAAAGTILPASKPDFDNYTKISADSLNGIVWKDDAQVVDGRCVKLYSERPSLCIEVREMIPK